MFNNHNDEEVVHMNNQANIGYEDGEVGNPIDGHINVDLNNENDLNSYNQLQNNHNRYDERGFYENNLDDDDDVYNHINYEGGEPGVWQPGDRQPRHQGGGFARAAEDLGGKPAPDGEAGQDQGGHPGKADRHL